MPAPNNVHLARSEGSRALVASGQQVSNKTAGPKKLPRSGRTRILSSEKDVRWQEEAWYFYDTIGEFEFACNWVGNLTSKAKLYVTKNGKRLDDKNHPAVLALDELYGSEDGKREALRIHGIHYMVAGDAATICWEDQETGELVWETVSPLYLRFEQGYFWVGERKIPDPKPLVFKTWRQHPADPNRVHAPSKAVSSVLAKLDSLAKREAAQIDSRLTSNGMLLVPNEIAISSAADGDDSDRKNLTSAENFVQELIDVASQSMSDRDSAAARIPIVLTADADHLKDIKWIELWSSLDKNSSAMESAAIRRLALGLDMPPEALLGVGDANRWSAWSVDEASIKSHVEPNLMSLCEHLTQAFLRPALVGYLRDGESLSDFSIMPDTSEMRLRPNRAKEALQLYDRGELTAETLRRETGFDEESKPTRDELAQWLRKKLATGSSTPEMMIEALRAFGVDIPRIEIEGPGREDRPAPSLKDGSRPELTDPEILEADAKRKANPDSAQRAALVAASEQMVFRALERAGNRIKNLHKEMAQGVYANYGASELYLFRDNTEDEVRDYLVGSFSQVSRFAGRLGVNELALEDALGRYTANLLMTKQVHRLEALEQALAGLEIKHG